jgi:phosphoglucosamine mutase
MSNLGLRKYCKEKDIKFVQTQVGDRYVLENMLKNDYNLGGEQSGHIIFLDYNPTGDGILTSLMLTKIILESKKDVTELKKIIKIYPQVLINAKVSSDKKYDFDKDEEIVKRINKLNDEFKENGRVLIRASGTEPLVRVMIEGEDQDYITKKAEELAKFIEERLK